jgi:hypothetical protein
MTDENLSVIAHFDVRRRGYVAPDGTAVGKLPSFADDVPALIALYRAMVLTRTFDLKAVSLQRTGRLGTYAVSLGQEAVSVGVASAMRREVRHVRMRALEPNHECHPVHTRSVGDLFECGNGVCGWFGEVDAMVQSSWTFNGLRFSRI